VETIFTMDAAAFFLDDILDWHRTLPHSQKAEGFDRHFFES
jgi:hypothetical protein